MFQHPCRMPGISRLQVGEKKLGRCEASFVAVFRRRCVIGMPRCALHVSTGAWFLSRVGTLPSGGRQQSSAARCELDLIRMHATQFQGRRAALDYHGVVSNEPPPLPVAADELATS